MAKITAKGSVENPARANENAVGKLHPAPITGELSAAGLHFGIVASRFNQFITDRLLAAALDALERAGVTEKQIELVRVPGSLEIPIAAKKLAQTRRCDAIICIGCVIRGATAHFEYVCNEVARGVQLAQLDTGVPMPFCVLTCDTLEQAIDRAGLKSGNKGFDAGLAAIEMANLSRKLAGKKAVKSKFSRRQSNPRVRRR
ncbi:MAG: 6,7-dimethyl-8-ribityllumazine synthase [Candidatus Acidiferrales bacterium]